MAGCVVFVQQRAVLLVVSALLHLALLVPMVAWVQQRAHHVPMHPPVMAVAMVQQMPVVNTPTPEQLSAPAQRSVKKQAVRPRTATKPAPILRDNMPQRTRIAPAAATHKVPASTIRPAKVQPEDVHSVEAEERRLMGDASGKKAHISIEQTAAAHASDAPPVAQPATNAMPRYKQLVQARLARFKNYPRRARKKKIEGQVLVALRVSRTGHVLGRQVTRSSGHKILDKAALQSVDDAAPFPAFSNAIGQQIVQLTVPFHYGLRD